MNSFQAQFNSLLGIALGAQKLSNKALGTPSAPTAKQPQATKEVEGSTQGELQPLKSDFGSNYMQSNVVVDREYQMAMLAKERSLQNLFNRHNALKALKGNLTFGGNN